MKIFLITILSFFNMLFAQGVSFNEGSTQRINFQKNAISLGIEPLLLQREIKIPTVSLSYVRKLSQNNYIGIGFGLGFSSQFSIGNPYEIFEPGVAKLFYRKELSFNKLYFITDMGLTLADLSIVDYCNCWEGISHVSAKGMFINPMIGSRMFKIGSQLSMSHTDVTYAENTLFYWKPIIVRLDLPF